MYKHNYLPQGTINIKNSSPYSCRIAAPCGGFGNHVRWLALLDPKFQFELTPLDDPNFPKILSPSEHIDFFNTENKLQSFRSQIYSANRSWDNWLRIEFLYRHELDNILVFSHSPNDLDGADKNLLLTINEELALRCYFKFNSALNHSTPATFKKEIQIYNSYITKNLVDKSKIKIMNADCLYQKNLDRMFYNSMIAWFELSDCYDIANEVHGLWFDSHQRAEKEFLQYVTRYYTKFLDSN